MSSEQDLGEVQWRTGMLLVPQHFQQARRTQESTVRARFSALQPLSFGVIELQFRQDELLQGQLRIERCGVVFPDGEYVQVPRLCAPPAACPRTLPAAQECADLLLVRTGRWRTQLLTVTDEREPAERETIDIAASELALELGAPGTANERLDAIKLGELRRDRNGRTLFVQAPLSCCLGASPELRDRLNHLLHFLEEQAIGIKVALEGWGGKLRQMTGVELRKQHLLLILNQQVVVLRELIKNDGAHPQLLHRELVRLAGGLAAFVPEVPLELPYYDHQNQMTQLILLEQRLIRLLSQTPTAESGAAACGVFAYATPYFTTHIADRSWLRRDAPLFLQIISRAIPPSELTRNFESCTRAAASDAIDDAVYRAGPRLKVTYTPNPPPLLPLRDDARYFRIDTSGSEWERVCASGRLAVYVSRALWRDSKQIERLELRLFGIEPGETP